MEASSLSPASRRRVPVWLPWVSGLVLIAGVIAVVVAYDVAGLRNTADTTVTPGPPPKPLVSVPPGKTVPLSKEARNVIIRFIDASVTRSDLVTSYKLAAPELRAGMSLAEWKTGTIPVPVFPLQAKGAGYSPSRILYSYKNNAQLQLSLIPSKQGEKEGVTPTRFWVGVKKIAGEWRVYYFSATGMAPILDANSTR